MIAIGHVIRRITKIISDRAFYGKVEGVKDLITFEGSIVDELEEGFKLMVEERIMDCSKNSIPLEKSCKGNLNIRLSPDVHKKAACKAALKGVFLNQLINDAIKDKLTSSDSEV